MRVAICLTIALGLLLCIGCGKPEKPLKEVAGEYWDAYAKGEWSTCYHFFSDEMKIRLGYEKGYIADRKALALRKIVVQTKLLDVEHGNDGHRGKVLAGLAIEGKYSPVVVEQSWSYDWWDKRWFIESDPSFRETTEKQ